MLNAGYFIFYTLVSILPLNLAPENPHTKASEEEISRDIIVPEHKVSFDQATDLLFTRSQDSLALVDFYNATQEIDTGWINKWDLTQPMHTWWGVFLDENGRVKVLDLDGTPDRIKSSQISNNRIHGIMPASFGQLTNMDTLVLAFVQLDKLPDEFGQLSALKHLNIQSSDFEEPLTAGIGNLGSLKSIIMNQVWFPGSIPSEIGQLVNLETLMLRGRVGQTGKGGFTGNLPPSLGNLINLKTLRIDNNEITGPIPSTLGQLTNLRTLYLANNKLNGTIPNTLGNINPIYIYLENNNLSGSIPANLRATSDIFLQNNQLSGSIPIELFTNLRPRNINFSNNNLSGMLPEAIANWSGIQKLDLSGNNLNGPLPMGLANIISIRVNQMDTLPQLIDLSENEFSGCFPNNYIRLCGLDAVKFDGNLNLTAGGDFDAFCENGNGVCNPERRRDSLALVDFYNATQEDPEGWRVKWDLEQPMDTWFGVFLHDDGTVKVLDFDGIADRTISSGTEGLQLRIRGEMPPSFGNLSALDTLAIKSINLDSLPNSIGNLQSLKFLDIRGAQIEGDIPTTIGELTNLTHLSFNSVNMTGPIPVGIGQLVNLTRLILRGDFRGGIPEEIGNLVELEELSIFGNPNLGGTIPSTLGNLSKIRMFLLYGNKLTGSIPPELGNVGSSGGKISTFSLRNNELTGSIPAELGNLNVNYFHLSDNRLSGLIPTNLSQCQAVGLLLQNNFLEGPLPKEFSKLTEHMFTFDVSNNRLSGPLPKELANSNGNLNNFLVNNNFFSGCFPQEYHRLCNLDSVNFSNNPDLPGGGDFNAFCTTGIGGCGDDCSSALEIPVNSDACSGNVIQTANYAASASSNALASNCGANSSTNDIWFKFRVPFSGNIAIQKRINTNIDLVLEAYSSDCNNLTPIPDGCAELDTQFYLILTGLTPNEYIHLRVWEKGNDATGIIELSGHGLPVNQEDWEFCNDQTGSITETEVGVSRRRANEYIVQYPEGITQAERDSIVDELIALGDTLLKSCNSCSTNPLELWSTKNPIEVDERTRFLRKKGRADTTKTSYNYIIEDIPCAGFGELDRFPPYLYKPSTNPEGEVSVVIIDSGVDTTNNLLQNALRRNEEAYHSSNCYLGDVYGYNFVDGNGDVMDKDAHGTRINGVLIRNFPEELKLNLINLKFYENNKGTIFDAVCGIYYAIEQGVDVINLSWGFTSNEFPQILYDALKIAEEEDILIVVSAGNRTMNLSQVNRYPSNFNLDNIIAVTAYEAETDGDNKELAHYGNFSTTHIDLATLGFLETTDLFNRLISVAGTSLSAPLVTRTAAIIRAKYPEMTYHDVRDCILGSSQPILSLEDKVATGAILDHESALECARLKHESRPILTQLTIEPEEAPEIMRLYPNPVFESLNIEYLIKNNNSPLRIEIYNELGQLMYQKVNNNTVSGFQREKIDVSSIPSGLFLLRLSTQNKIATKIFYK